MLASRQPLHFILISMTLNFALHLVQTLDGLVSQYVVWLLAPSFLELLRIYHAYGGKFLPICVTICRTMEIEDEKHFDEWNEVKKTIHHNGHLPKITEGSVFWCGFGENVGVEINGKNSMFSRPMLVFKKLSRYGFLGIPLSSQAHVGSWYVSFKFQGRDEIAVLSQARTFSVSRIYNKMGQIDESDMLKIRDGFHNLYCK